MYTVLPLYVTLYFDLQCTHFPKSHLLVNGHQLDREHATDAGVAHDGHQGQGHACAKVARRGTRREVLLYPLVRRGERRVVSHVDPDLRSKGPEL